MILEHQADPQPGSQVEPRTPSFLMSEHRSLMDVWRVLTKQRFTIITVTILFLAGAVWYAFRTTPVYESVSRIEIKQSEIGNGDLLGLFEAEDEAAEALKTEVRILQSDTVLFETAQALHLLSRVRGNKDGKTASSADITPRERAAMIGMVRGGLSVLVIPDTRLVEIRYQSTDPQLGTNIVNQLVETYSDAELQTKFDRTEHVSQWLQKRMDSLRQEASNTQQALADYQRAHNIVGTDENSNLTIQTLENISGELDNAEADRIMKESRMRDFNSMSPDMIALLGDNTALTALHSQLTDLQTQRAQLGAKFGPKHPQMLQLDVQINKVQTQINNEVELARRQVNDEYKVALGLEDDLRKRLGTQEEMTYRLNEGVAQYAILRHQAELTRDLYDALQMRLKEASISAGMSAANITVVDRASVPFIPVSPQKSRALLFGLFGGLLVGCVLAFVIESVDDRLRTSEEVESASMLPSLAAIPNMAAGAARHKGEAKEKAPPGAFQTPHQLITLWDPKSHGAEAYRGLRSSLLLSSIDNPPRIIVITSAFPSEGKTTTAINFSIVLAQRGEKVLLVDADLRRGSLRRVFGIPDNGFGLSTALSQPTVESEIPVPFPDLPTFHVMPTGPLPPNPAEMLSSNRMEDQMRQWVNQFDRIVIDSAPLLAVSDTQSLAVRADAVVLVARAGVTRKRALLRARDLLWRVNAPVAGVVVNDVDLRLENFYTYRYGAYARNYWYGYKQAPSYSDRAYGYEDEDEKKKNE